MASFSEIPADFVDRDPNLPFPLIQPWESLSEIPPDAWFTRDGVQFSKIVGIDRCDSLVAIEAEIGSLDDGIVERKWFSLRQLMKWFAWTLDPFANNVVLNRCGIDDSPAWARLHTPDWYIDHKSLGNCAMGEVQCPQ